MQGKDAAGAGTNNLEACWSPDGQGLPGIARRVIQPTSNLRLWI
jgi:hypothetical protein